MSLSKVCLRAPEGKKEEFKGASSLFSVSMGLEKILMQGRCLEETIKIINSTFGCCDIVISDALQRFNLLADCPEMSETEALKRTLEIGSQWLMKHEVILQELKIPHTISRWSDWLSSRFFSEKYKFVSSLFEEDFYFQRAVQESILRYFKRQEKFQNERPARDLKQMLFAVQFILEEAAVMLLWCDAGYDFELHPSPRSVALVYVHAKYQSGKNLIPKLRQGRVKILGGCEDVRTVEI